MACWLFIVFLFPRRWGVGLTAGQALGEKITDKAPRQAISIVPTFFISRPRGESSGTCGWLLGFEVPGTYGCLLGMGRSSMN